MSESTLSRIFVSYATPNVELAKALVNFLRLGCDLQDKRVFMTARPGSIPAGSEFKEVIRDSLDGATVAILLLTPSYYESRFCLAEAGAVWVQKKVHVPLLVPPVDYHELEGVQLGEQALKINASSDLDAIRDLVREHIGTSVDTGSWNEHKETFLNTWTTDFEGRVQGPTSFSAEEYEVAANSAAELGRANSNLQEDSDRLKKLVQRLKEQNEDLRAKVPDAPAPPVLEGDVIAQSILEAETAIETAQAAMEALPPIAREALFQMKHRHEPLAIGVSNSYDLEDARSAIEDGYLTPYEEDERVVTPRSGNPRIDEADTALTRVRETAFGGWSVDSEAHADDFMKPILKDRYAIDDPTFELRPVWQALRFL